MHSKKITHQRCPDCGRTKSITKEYCQCGYKFPQQNEPKKIKFLKRIYQFIWGNNSRRKNTISVFIIVIGIVLILQGFNIEHKAYNHIGVPEYIKIRERYWGSSRYFLSSQDEMLTRANAFKMVGIIFFSLGIISVFSKWLIRPLTANSAKHDKYQW